MITDDTAGAGLAARGPYFDELEHGMVFDGAPGVTLTEGGAAMHQAVVGDRLPAATDHELGRRLTGSGPLAHPAYVWDVCIGQSTTATHFVKRSEERRVGQALFSKWSSRGALDPSKKNN